MHSEPIARGLQAWNVLLWTLRYRLTSAQTSSMGLNSQCATGDRRTMWPHALAASLVAYNFLFGTDNWIFANKYFFRSLSLKGIRFLVSHSCISFFLLDFVGTFSTTELW